MSTKDDRPMMNDLLSLRERLNVLHEDLISFLVSTKAKVEENAAETSLLCDLGYLMKDMGNVADECRKLCNQRSELIGHIIAYFVTMRSLGNTNANLKVKGEYSRGVPDCARKPVMPKKGSPELKQLMTTLGVPQDLIEDECVKPSYEGVTRRLGQLAAAGKPMPEGLVGTFPVYKTTFYRLSGKILPKGS